MTTFRSAMPTSFSSTTSPTAEVVMGRWSESLEDAVQVLRNPPPCTQRPRIRWTLEGYKSTAERERLHDPLRQRAFTLRLESSRDFPASGHQAPAGRSRLYAS